MVDMEMLNQGKKHLSPALARSTQIIMERGEGATTAVSTKIVLDLSLH